MLYYGHSHGYTSLLFKSGPGYFPKSILSHLQIYLWFYCVFIVEIYIYCSFKVSKTISFTEIVNIIIQYNIVRF